MVLIGAGDPIRQPIHTFSYSLLELQFGKFGITNVGEECSVEIGNCPVKFNDDPDLGAVFLTWA